MRIKKSSAKNFVVLTFFSLLTVLFILNEAAGASITATQEWVAIYDGSASQYDDPAKTVVDSSGNIYVTGRSGWDFATIKYDKAGTELWKVKFAPSTTSTDIAKSIAVDGDGNVYVAGDTSKSSGYQYALVKYNSAGVEQWVQTYDGGGTHALSAMALNVDGGDSQTYIYITGYSGTSTSSATADYATIKYDTAGNELWVARFDAAGSTDVASALVVDGSSNVYVTGKARYSSPTTQYRYATIKYNSTGVQQWVMTYGGDGTSSHSAWAIGLDSGGNVVVSGTTVTIKYNTAGVEQWVTPFVSGLAYSLATDTLGNTYTSGTITAKFASDGTLLWSDPFGGNSITVDGDDNIYVAGFVKGDTSVDLNNNDFKTVKFASDGTALWTMQHDGGEEHSDLPRSMALYLDGSDSNTYVIVTGMTESDYTQSNFETIKYAGLDGTEQWVNKFDGFASSTSIAKDIALDSSDNVYVTGFTYVSDSLTNYATVKYDPDGVELWAKQYDFAPVGGGDKAQAIAVDSVGNVYVTGTFGDVTNASCGTVMYDTDGVFQWEAVYADAAHTDACIDIKVFEDGLNGQTYTYVAAQILTTNENDIAVVKYNSSGGEEWAQTYSFNGSDSYGNILTSLVIDADGTAYLAGSGQTVQGYYAATVVAFDKNGTYLWDGPGYSITANDSQFEDMTVDASGNAYLTGHGEYSYFLGGQSYDRTDMVTAKYDSAGNELWAVRYGDAQTSQYGKVIALDSAGNVYVGAHIPSATNTHDLGLIKYNAFGVEQWARSFDGGNQSHDFIADIAVDSAGTIYITAASANNTSYSEYTTIAYDGSGNQLWFERYASTYVYGSDSPNAMEVTDDGNIYVTGKSVGDATSEDFGTVKYSQALVTSDTVAPFITAISPADGEIDVAKNPTPSVTFSEPMDPLKILDGAIFSVRNSATGLNIYGTKSYDVANQKLEFDSHVFDYGEMYTATLREGATDLAGNPAGSRSWSFTMVDPPDNTPPEFVSGSPTNGATGVITVPYIAATFNEPMLAYTFSNSWFNPDFPFSIDGSFKLVNNSTGLEVIPVSSELTSYDEATMTATLHLESPLDIDTTYTVTLVGSQIRDASNNALGDDVSWSFTTGSLGDTTAPLVDTVVPDVDATDVAVDIVYITATFNETMKADSFTTDQFEELFTVAETASGIPVNGWLNSVVGDTATFYLGAPLTLDTEYTATIDAAVTNVSGIALGTDYTWTFSTGAGTPSDDDTPPHVASVTPDGSSLTPPTVGLLTVTFNEAMDAATIEGASDGSGTGSPFTLMVTDGAYITGTVVYDPGARTARFYPDTDLSYDTDYTANMANTVTDAAGNALVSEYSWEFTTSGDPGVLGCDVDAGILEGCANFDDFNYGTGVLVNTYTTGSTGPTSEGARRKLVADNKAYSNDDHFTDNIESEASAYADTTRLRLEARASDINVTSERDGAASYVATKVDVTGAPPGTLIPMTVTINRSFQGDGYSAELQVHDFDNRPLGTIIVRKGFQQITRLKDIYADSSDPLNYQKPKESGSDSAVMAYNLLYPAIPNNGIFLYFGAGAKKTIAGLEAVESNFIATLEFNPPPGVTVTLATGQSVTGETDTDGDGVADNEELSDGDASVATMDTPTGTGQVEVAVDSSSGTGATLSQCEALDDSDISLNQSNKPGDYAFPDGIVSFNVNGLPLGGTAVVTVTFPTAIPAGSKYYKVNADGFYEFLSGAEIATNTVTLTLVDGGQGDHDGIENGIIDDPGGIAVPQPCTAEIWYDGINQSCKTGSDYDQDGDGFDLEVDCDDTDVAINYGETEIWYDGINQSCKDGSDYDQDGDGHDSIAHGGDDCDDTDPSLIESCVVDDIFKNSFE